MGYDNLEKISATIFRPASNIEIKHSVKVAHRDKNGMRQYAHAEYDYSTNNYTNKKRVKSIKLTFDSYITIEDTSKDWSDDRAVRIGYMQLPLFSKSLETVVDWFVDEKYDTLYYIENGISKLNLDFRGLKEVVSLGFGKGLVFSPTVICMDDLYYEGVELIINNKNCIGYITVDNLIAMQYIFRNMNLYTMGLQMLDYVGRPEFDEYSNEVRSSSSYTNFTQPEDEIESQSTSNIKKDHTNKKLKGFFK